MLDSLKRFFSPVIVPVININYLEWFYSQKTYFYNKHYFNQVFHAKDFKGI